MKKGGDENVDKRACLFKPYLLLFSYLPTLLYARPPLLLFARVRVLAPLLVNGASTSLQATQNQSLAMLQSQGIQVRVTVDPQTAQTPYMHARSAVRDGKYPRMCFHPLAHQNIRAHFSSKLLFHLHLHELSTR